MATVLAVLAAATAPTAAAARPTPSPGQQGRHHSGDDVDGTRRRAGDNRNDGRGGKGTAGRHRATPVKGPVLAATGTTADPVGAPTGPGVQNALGTSVRDGSLGTLNFAVADAATGKLLYGSGENTPATPASTTKLATAVAALALIPPTTRLSTTVVRGAEPGTITLVGGGDPTLTVLPADQIRIGGQLVDADTAPASLADLASRTAAALRAAGTTTVKLGYDTSLYTGPLLHKEHDATNIAAVTPLMVDEGRIDPKSPDEAPARVFDPAGQAAAALADRLRAEGITVTGTPARSAPPSSPRCGRRPSPGSSSGC
ncbi:D-alanyl-D-alanine carboxypeptidase [Kitasatospora sp. KL5]|uniref:D-alanyl-D-alanine carboxypeptidase n=1 Tax=Kitasatospora sp. KL5 TaxID=3425125 RepID=UPI003D6E8C96